LFKEILRKFEVDIHAWALMTNHVHMLATPKLEEGLSKNDAVARSNVRAIF
jgi:putative transposase